MLDACNEEINNHIFRQGHVSLGLSSALIGSGMAFDYQYLHQLLRDIGETPGEDKELEFKILREGVKIAYLPTAYVYDEKIPNSKVFTAQRTRWLAAQQEFLRKNFLEGIRQLGRGNIDFTDKVLQVLLLPRILLLGLLGACSLLSLWWAPGPGPLFWFGLLASTILALMLALPKVFVYAPGRPGSILFTRGYGSNVFSFIANA
ncbi:MAG: glycosyltransferase family 2 protein [Hymenobacter sp.]